MESFKNLGTSYSGRVKQKREDGDVIDYVELVLFCVTFVQNVPNSSWMKFGDAAEMFVDIFMLDAPVKYAPLSLP